MALQKFWKAAALAACVSTMTFGVAHADLTQNGAVGLPLNPTAQIPEPGGVRIQANYFNMGDFIDAPSQDVLNESKFYGLHAAGRVGQRLEINGGIEKLSARDNTAIVQPGTFDEFDKTGFSLGVKYLITRESEETGKDLGRVRIAVGAGHSRTQFKNTHLYVVGTKAFGRGDRAPILGHLGLRYDRFSFPTLEGELFALTPNPRNPKGFSVYGGVEVPVTRDGSFSVIGELQSKRSESFNYEFLGIVGGYDAKMPYSLSVRYRPPGQGFSATVGIARQGIAGYEDSGLFAQLGYSFGKK